MATTASPLSTGDNLNSLRKIWQTLTEPAPEVQGENRRKASTLSALLVVFLPLALLVILVNPITTFLSGTPTNFSIPGLLGVFIIFVAYCLSRSRYYEVAAYITVGVPIFAVVATTLTSATPASLSSMVYAILSITLSSLLLDARGTVVAGVGTVAVMVFAHSRPGATQDSISTLLMYVIVTTSIMAVVSSIKDGYMKSLEVARVQLQEQIVVIDQARERAERSDQVKSAFLASMSHELRTPLNAVINFTRFVIDGDTGPVNEQQTELLTEVVGSAKHLLNLINDVLDMSKIEAGSLNLFIEDDINLNSIVNSVVTTGRGLLAGKPTRLHTDVEENLPLIRADRQRILQILLNIMSNACKFTEEGDIRVKMYQKNGEVIIALSDTGPGIAPADQAMVFEPFKQTKAGLRQGGGTGLGMPIAKSLAESHGGRLWLESELGKGATFYVALPIKSELLVPMPA
jgi:signal transduction histidine kinase